MHPGRKETRSQGRNIEAEANQQPLVGQLLSRGQLLNQVVQRAKAELIPQWRWDEEGKKAITIFVDMLDLEADWLHSMALSAYDPEGTDG